MIKRVTLMILFLPVMAMANSGSIPSGANFKGYIGNQKVKMVLINDNGHISGHYGKADHSQHDNYIKNKNYFDGKMENHQRLKLTVSRYNKNKQLSN